MNTQKFETWWNEYGMGMPKDFESRDEQNAWIDYQLARNKGKSPEEAMAHAEAQLAKFGPAPAGKATGGNLRTAHDEADDEGKKRIEDYFENAVRGR